MMRWLMMIALICLMISIAPAQVKKQSHSAGIYRVSMLARDRQRQAESEPFLDPAKALIKVSRQVGLQLLPENFFPKVETETDPQQRRLLRYGVFLYRDCQVDIVDGLVDIMVGVRIDTRNGIPIIKYYPEYFIINPKIVQFQEGRMALAVLPDAEGSALLFLKEGNIEQLVSIEGIFEEPHTVNLISLTDLEGIVTDQVAGKFAVFVRGGESRASLFALNTDTSLKDLKGFEVLKTLSTTERAYIFAILSNGLPTLPPYRGASVK